MPCRRVSRRVAVALWAAVFATLTLTARSRGDDWPTYAHDPQHTGRSDTNFDPRQLQFSWMTPPVNQFGYSHPILVGSTLYAVDYHQSGGGSQITSFGVNDGHVNWSYGGNGGLGGPVSSVSYSDGLLAYTTNFSGTDELAVLDAATGAPLYQVQNVPGTFQSIPPVLVPDPAGGLTAYTAGSGAAAAAHLGSTSGSRLWIQPGSLGGNATPTVVENSIVAAGPGQYYAYDRATGATNHFLQSALSGGGGATIPYDAQRREFYVPDVGGLTAYQYTDNSHITQLWSVSHAIGAEPFVALAADGRIYTEGSDGLLELDPATGQVLHSVPEDVPQFRQLLITGNDLWVGGDGITAYDLNTLSPVVTLHLPPGFENFGLTPVAADDSHLVLQYATGFAVYSVPESAGLLWGPIAIALCARSRVSRRTTGSRKPLERS